PPELEPEPGFSFCAGLDVGFGVGGAQGFGCGFLPPAPPPPNPQGRNGGNGSAGLPVSRDPNSKTGPSGFGTPGFISPGQTFPYRIDFENDPIATAPVQRLNITDQLDPNLDWSSFALTEVGFGDTTLIIPPGSQHFQATVPVTSNGVTFNLEIELGV